MGTPVASVHAIASRRPTPSLAERCGAVPARARAVIGRMIHSTTRYCRAHDVTPPRTIVIAMPAATVTPALTLRTEKSTPAMSQGPNDNTAHVLG